MPTASVTSSVASISLNSSTCPAATLKRSRLGLGIYAIGSGELAAFRSGVAVSRTRICGAAIYGTGVIVGMYDVFPLATTVKPGPATLATSCG